MEEKGSVLFVLSVSYLSFVSAVSIWYIKPTAFHCPQLVYRQLVCQFCTECVCVCVCDGDDGDVVVVDEDEAGGHDVSITFFTSIPLQNLWVVTLFRWATFNCAPYSVACLQCSSDWDLVLITVLGGVLFKKNNEKQQNICTVCTLLLSLPGTQCELLTLFDITRYANAAILKIVQCIVGIRWSPQRESTTESPVPRNNVVV